jgi:hypothetical protein
VSTTIWLKAAMLWLAILALAILNGVVRESVLIPAVGAFTGLILSGSILSCCIFIVAFVGAPWYGRLASAQWLAIGLFWLLLTLAFEFGFGRFWRHATWTELFAAYSFRGGNIWPVVLVVTFISPCLAAKIRKR